MSTIETLSIVIGVYLVVFVAHRAEKAIHSSNASAQAKTNQR